jgi:diguanylate cyclase (GGDEF)-like protein/putative nucleotidyltransferase with HDIG domain
MTGRYLLHRGAARGSHAERLGDLPAASRRFILGVIAAGVLVLALAATDARFDRPALFIQMLSLALLTATVKLWLPLSRSVSTLSVSNALTFASILLLDVGGTVVIGVVAAWGQCTFRPRSRNPLHRTLFSMATVGISAYAATIVFEAIMGSPAAASGQSRAEFVAAAPLLEVLRAIIPSAVVYFAVNSGLVAAVVALTTHQSIYRTFTGSYLWSAPSYFVAAGIGCAALFVDRFSQAWGVLVAVPLYLTYRSYRSVIARIEEERAQVRQLSDVQLATIEALALAIEVKDHTSHSHIQAFQVYAEGLAREVGAGEDEIRAIKTAALLHDIGNLAVPEYILGKPGPLTPEEFRKLQTHPRVGANIVESVPFPYPVSPLILSHHEHWDGSGYPERLAGERIPLGARVLKVVDFFTALLADRPYRPGRSFDRATGMLREHAGTTLDPTLVERFIAILPALHDTLQRLHASRMATCTGPRSTARGEALEDIADAQREAKVVHEIAQALGSSLRVDDTFHLVAEKLRLLLPYATCALFLANEAGKGTLYCVHASGLGGPELLRLPAARLEELAAAACGVLASASGSEAPPEYLAAPLALGEVLIGALAVYRDAPGRFGAEHRRLLHLIAQQAAPVVHNSLVFARTQEASLTDPLTGLPNRRALQQQLGAALARPVSSGQTTAVLLFDLDMLKHLNDTFGHRVGDRAILEVARRLDGMRRRTDLCARYAGDEFVMVLWDCDAVEVRARATALQEAVAALRLDIGPGGPVPLAVSVGAALCPHDGRTAEALIAVADQRMYEDKVQRKRRRTPVEPDAA